MNERRTDFELLRDFVQGGDQLAFTSVVQRHLNLVYATAWRQVLDEGVAQEVTQNVFVALAKKSWHFAPDDSLSSWLYRATLLEGKKWWRQEMRRRQREQTAAELGTTMKPQDEQTVFHALIPLLDEALLALREKERTALLLRFYEGRSLRELGAALGIQEDAAQKRVAAAIGKMSAYFQRRGFKTATIAATAAALQQTVVSAPATTAELVVSASVQAAPHALGSLTAGLMRIVSLSKAQTAAVCVLLTLVPVTVQWKQTQHANQEMALWRQRLDDVRLQEQQLDANVQRLGRESVALEARVSKDVSRRARNQEALRKFQDLKTRSRALLTAANYRWPDDSPFVRIPKWALPSIKVPGPTTAEKLQAKITSFLDLTPAELAVTSQLFSKYNTETDRLLEHGLSETNQSPDLSLPSGAESRVFIMEPLGQKIRNALDQLCNELAAIMGEDRWGKIKPSQYELNDSEQTRLLGYGSDKWEQRQEIAVNIFVKPGSDPTVNYVAPGGAGCGPIPLRMFLGGNAEFMFEGGGLPQAAPKLIERVKHYISEQAVARLSTSVPK